MKLYAMRMTIECSFRDIKNRRNGFALSETLTMNAQRLQILFLIALIATLAVWLAGTIGQQSNLQFAYQTNTTRKRTVLSVFFLGLEILRSERSAVFKSAEINNAMFVLQNAVSS